ncbi:hypothetical protein RHSIM_Rhsim11G0065700 [Rhododendron simsii]|uniref:Ribosomal protein S13 n=1 Tax=Rhododendron simsii TaxID=118357 RepID=A0A834G8D7_RHOSS|nr:hypothetical protein RHSIM_Rhsim11G0065700 [Rhododendron simsii]
MALQALATPFPPSFCLISNKPTRNPNSLSYPTPTPPKFPRLIITCARVGGVEIPNNKRVEYSLQYIHGIGRTRARQILIDLSMDNKITKDLNEDELTSLRQKVSSYMIEGDLVIPSLSLSLSLSLSKPLPLCTHI